MTGRYRVYAGRSDDELLLLDTEAADPTYVPREADDEQLDRRLAAVAPGHLVEATVDWTGDGPRVEQLKILEETVFTFTRGVTDVFQAALQCMGEADREGRAMNSRLTRGQDGEVNGVVYAFARQAGARDLFTEFRDGRKPLEPLLDRIEGADPPYEVFVIEPREEPFVLVYIVLEKGGLLAETVRDSYVDGTLADRLGGVDGETDGPGGSDDADDFDVFDGL